MHEERTRLEDEARAAAGLEDFGEDSYREGLDEVLAALDEAAASDRTRQLVCGTIRGLLQSRLHSQAGWDADPDCLRAAVPTPLIIAGIPRTGTTALHHLLSVDPRFQWIPHWIATAPLRRPPRPDWESHPMHRKAVAALAARQRNNPRERAVHNVEADRAEECLNVMAQSFVTMMFTSSMPLPRYHAWFFAQDETASYQRYADNLRLIGAGDDRLWLLKNPSHTRGMAPLLATFPDAKIVMTYRDPVQAIPSGASTIQTVSGSGWDPQTLGEHRLKIWSDAARRAEAARAREPARFHEVDYRAVVAEPLEVARSIYRFAHLELRPEVEADMRAWIAANPQSKHGEHRYTPEQFGLTAGRIRGEFADYVERYGLRPG